MNAIEIKDLCKSYENFELDHLHLTLPSGCIMGLIGENGAGKSTTIKLMLNMIHKDAGTIRILEKDHQRDARLIKEEIGVVLDDVGISGCLQAGQVDKIMCRIFKNWDGEQYRSYLRILRIPCDKPYREFSRGMKMKLGIAIALSHHAKLLILDEATAGLDPVVRDEILDVFCEFTRQEDHSILMSSHIVSDLEKVCDYIAFLHQGKLLLCEQKDVLKENYRLVHCTQKQFALLPERAVVGKKENAYGVEAIVEKDSIMAGMHAGMIDIEQLFVFMAKEAQR